jgi:hypothetical protein
MHHVLYKCHHFVGARTDAEATVEMLLLTWSLKGAFTLGVRDSRVESTNRVLAI